MGWQSPDLPPLETRELQDAPVVVFTMDVEWAPEWAIRETLSLFDSYNTPLTPFLTHDSLLLRERYGLPAMRKRAGVHPNFLPSSSHGRTECEVIDHVCGLWPDAVGFRSHCFVDSSPITEEFVRRGFRYDSNLCLFLQPRCVPLLHASGLTRFPVYWEDDVHYRRMSFEEPGVIAGFDSPGLKVVNIHPFSLALNTPTLEFYNAHKHLYRSKDPEEWRKAVFPGKGSWWFLGELLQHVARRGHKAMYLHDLYEEVTGQGEPNAATSPVRTSEPVGPKVAEYWSASPERRAEAVRDLYDQRDVSQTYATSRDFNLRELEIGFLAEHLTGGRVLDLGCGNGYTLLSLARTLAADYTGMDFSANMLDGARRLTEQLSRELRSVPKWVSGDVRRLDLPDGAFDFVITERCLQNLPTREDQFSVIRDIHRVLKPGGFYLMVEGTNTGLRRLNRLRQKMGLEIIPPVSEDNVSALRFDEDEIEPFLEDYFTIEAKRFFGTYYLISRVVHPLLVAPERPRWDARINTIARKLCEALPDVERLGHVMGYKLRKKTA